MTKPNVQMLRMTPEQALRIVRECMHDGRIHYSAHLFSRSSSRGISMKDVVNCIRNGEITKDPIRDSNTGDWKCTLTHITAGAQIHVVVAIDIHAEPHVTVVITTY